jgi:hypothetical protein
MEQYTTLPLSSKDIEDLLKFSDILLGAEGDLYINNNKNNIALVLTGENKRDEKSAGQVNLCFHVRETWPVNDF